MLAQLEAEPRSPRGAEEVRTLDARCIENSDRVCNSRSQRIGSASRGFSLPP
jgi:hypothetical protein